GGVWMKIDAIKEEFDKIKTELLVIGTFEKELSEEAKKADKLLKGTLSAMIKKEQFTGEWKQFEILSTLGNMPAERVLIVGLGKKGEFDIEKLRKAAGMSAKIARDENAKKYTTVLQNTGLKATVQEKAQAVAEATILALYDFNHYKTDKSKIKTVESVSLAVDAINDAKKGIERGIVYAEATVLARDIVNMPANIMTPEKFTEEAQKVAKEGGMKITVMGRKEMEKAGMNTILAVSLGSDKEPRFIVMEYNPGKTNSTLAIVGKGITFDTGGVDIKPWDSMETMKSDKAGASAVLGIMKTCARLKPSVRVIGAMAVTENMVGAGAMKPGDIVKAYNGKTIEIMNTDAEGRLVLADAISYVEKNYKPSAIIDLATLTGACVIAIGYHASGLICTDRKLAEKIIAAGNKVYEKVWEFPFWEEYQDVYKSDNADVRNVSKEKYGPGVINGAVFIKQFVEKTPWAHLDIAGPAWISSSREYVPASATGWGVRLITQLIEDWK
ncbi:MAG: leucyl aminopeptidase, partial [Candidatus Aenigmarchaeota archaeon]|nr:leucyl aminopeptidase [Candidatus Aenigmarchaeota archaeon]MDI6722905.1 leucyl aminopeptidase [Candidatus Aenigmarchaeota archaeon]